MPRGILVAVLSIIALAGPSVGAHLGLVGDTRSTEAAAQGLPSGAGGPSRPSNWNEPTATTLVDPAQSVTGSPVWETGAVTATIPVGNDPLADACDSGNGDVYVANLAGGSVSVINGVTNTVVATIPVGTDPGGLAYDSTNGNVYVANSGTDNVSVISGATNSVVATIPVGSGPVGPAYDSGNSDVYIENFDSNNVSVISGGTNTVSATIPVPDYPNGAAYDGPNRDVYVTTISGVSVISGESNLVVTTVSVPGNPSGATYDSGNGDVYVAISGSNLMSVISGATNTVLANFDVGAGVSGAAYDADNGAVYAPNAYADAAIVISTLLSIDGLLPSLRGSAEVGVAGAATAVGSQPYGVAYDGDNDAVYVANHGANTVSVVDAATGTVTATVPLGPGASPWGIAYDGGNGEVYVADNGLNEVSVIDSANSVVAVVAVGAGPEGVAYDSGDGDVYVANGGSHNVTVIDGATNTRVTSIEVPVGSGADGVAYDSGNGNVYVTFHSTGDVGVINGTNALATTIGDVGTGPTGMAYDTGNGELYVVNNVSAAPSCVGVCPPGVTVIGPTDDIVTTIDVADGLTYAVYDGASGDIYVGDYGEGSIQVVSGTTNQVIGTLSGPGIPTTPNGLAYDSRNGDVYVTDFNGSGVVPIRTLAGTTAPTTATLDAGQSLLLTTPLVGVGTGRLTSTIVTNNSSGLACSVASLGLEEISAACIGAGPGVYAASLTVVDSVGSSVETTLTLTVLADPIISSLTAIPLTLDVGQTTLLATPGAVGGSGGYSYAWSGLPAGCLTQNTTDLACAPTVAGSNTVTVTAVDSNGVSVAATPLTLVVTADPLIDTPVASPGTLDVGQSTTLTAALVNPGSGGDVYRWSGLPGGAGCPSGDVLSLTCTPATPGTYVVTVTVTDSNGATGTAGPVVILVSAAPAGGAAGSLTIANATAIGLSGGALAVALVALFRKGPRGGASTGRPPRSE